MKRFCCMLLSLCILGCAVPALAEEWTYYESPYGFSLWYDAQAYLIEDDWEDGAVVVYPLALYTPLESRDASGRIAVLKDEKMPAGIRIEQPSAPVDADWTPSPDRVLLEKELDVAWPYICTTMNVENGVPGPYTVDDLFVLLPTCFFSAGIAYPQGDPDGWGEKLWEVLSTLEFPPQPVVNDDFLLDFFQGGAAGMRFTDVIVDAEAEPVVLLPLRELRDFSLNRIVWDEDTFEPIRLEPLYTADRLSPGDNLKISCWFSDVLPDLCVQYTDAEDVPWSLSLFQSGMDGSLLLIPEDAF